MAFDRDTSRLVDERDALLDRVAMLEAERLRLLRENNALRQTVEDVAQAAHYVITEHTGGKA